MSQPLTYLVMSPDTPSILQSIYIDMFDADYVSYALDYVVYQDLADYDTLIVHGWLRLSVYSIHRFTILRRRPNDKVVPKWITIICGQGRTEDSHPSHL